MATQSVRRLTRSSTFSTSLSSSASSAEYELLESDHVQIQVHVAPELQQEAAGVDHEIQQTLTSIQLGVKALVKQLTVSRKYMRYDDAAGCAVFDPRFLVFEYMLGLVLRPRQVQLVNSLVASAANRASSVQQMIMGQGMAAVCHCEL